MNISAHSSLSSFKFNFMAGSLDHRRLLVRLTKSLRFCMITKLNERNETLKNLTIHERYPTSANRRSTQALGIWILKIYTKLNHRQRSWTSIQLFSPINFFPCMPATGSSCQSQIRKCIFLPDIVALKTGILPYSSLGKAEDGKSNENDRKLHDRSLTALHQKNERKVTKTFYTLNHVIIMTLSRD